MTKANTPLAGVDQTSFDDYTAPLVKHFTVRLTATQYAGVITRALSESSPEGSVVRRWIVKGAAAEGIDLNCF